MANFSTEQVHGMLELDSGANVYPEDSSSDDEHLLTQQQCNYRYGESDPDYIPLESDDDDEDEEEEDWEEEEEYTSTTSAHHGSPPTLCHPPPPQTYSDDGDDVNFEPASSTMSAPLPVSPIIRRSASALASVPPTQQQLETSSCTSPAKRRHTFAPSPSPDSDFDFDSDSSVRVMQAKRKAKRGRRGSASTETARWEEEDERWHNKEEKDIKPNPLRFMPARPPGPTLDTTAPWTPLSLFRLFFSNSAVRTLISNTNAHAANRLQAGMKFKWTPLTYSDFWIFMSILLFTGLVAVHHRSDYWRKEWPYGFSFPRNAMTRGRFEEILFSLHLSNPTEDEENDRKKNTAEYDRLFKIKPLYTQIVSACQAHFHPYRNICIDERMVASKARISMKQYMKAKPTKWGYKLFVLADAQTAYTFNFFVYQGKSESAAAHGLGFSSVWNLLPFQTLGGGYTLYVDNFYTSPVLFEELLKKNIGCCGTSRVGNPKTEVNSLPKNAERGDMRWLRRGKLLFVKWRDTRDVNMCSTVHEAFAGQTVKRRVKEAGVWKIKDVPVPCAVLEYNRFMGGVDLSDALIKYYSVHHKTMKWYKTFFYHFIDIAVVNSFLLHKELCKKRNEKPYNQKKFREKLSKEMLEFGIGSASPPQTPPPVTCMPVFYQQGERKHCQRCRDAGIKRIKTRVYCRKCQVPLCFVTDKNCFVEWHDARH